MNTFWHIFCIMQRESRPMSSAEIIGLWPERYLRWKPNSSRIGNKLRAAHWIQTERRSGIVHYRLSTTALKENQ